MTRTSPGASRDLTAKIIAALRQMIAGGAIQHGGKLPAERDLAKQFGVNRASLRPALKALEVMGVVRQHVGEGTFVTQDASSILNVPLDFLLLVDGITFGELYEARRIFEPELSAQAARRRTLDEILPLEQSVIDMKCHFEAGSLVDVAACDQRFHRLIWEMAGNRVCLRMLVPLHRVMTNSFAVSWSLRDYASAVSAHSAIFQAIGAGDPEAARQHMNAHLDRAESINFHHARRGDGREPDQASQSMGSTRGTTMM